MVVGLELGVIPGLPTDSASKDSHAKRSRGLLAMALLACQGSVVEALQNLGMVDSEWIWREQQKWCDDDFCNL